jgi:hypothetical protein
MHQAIAAEHSQVKGAGSLSIHGLVRSHLGLVRDASPIPQMSVVGGGIVPQRVRQVGVKKKSPCSIFGSSDMSLCDTIQLRRTSRREVQLDTFALAEHGEFSLELAATIRVKALDLLSSLALDVLNEGDHLARTLGLRLQALEPSELAEWVCDDEPPLCRLSRVADLISIHVQHLEGSATAIKAMASEGSPGSFALGTSLAFLHQLLGLE